MFKTFTFNLILATSLVSVTFAQEVSDTFHYPNPGIIAYRDGRWVGSDHLYNLTSRIDVVVEFFLPQKLTVPITVDDVKQKIVDIFKTARISLPSEEEDTSKPPLPFFHMLVMIYPVEKGYVAFCEGRLFEQVTVSRVVLDEQTAMQAITWESQNLVITSREDLGNQILKSVEEIATNFANRYKFYEDIRLELQKRTQR